MRKAREWEESQVQFGYIRLKMLVRHPVRLQRSICGCQGEERRCDSGLRDNFRCLEPVNDTAVGL